MRRYALTMGIRVVCFVLMVFVQPYGWWTWVFAAAAAFLPYFAVVAANAGSGDREVAVESPAPKIEAPQPATVETPPVLRIDEDRKDES